MHIHWIANTIVPPPISLSGGDRIMVECIRRWSQQHRITVYGNEGARQLCDWFELKGIDHVTWPADHLGWILQSQTNAATVGLIVNSNAWTDVAGSASSTSATITVDSTKPTVFFRLRQP